VKRLLGALLAGLSLALTPTVARAATGFLCVPAAGEVRQFDLASGQIVQTLKVPVANVYRNSVRTDDGRLLVAGNEAVSIIDEADPARVVTLPLPVPAVPAQTVETDIPVLEKPTVRRQRLFGIDYEPRTGITYLGVHRDDGETTLYRLDHRRRDLQIMASFRDIADPRDLVVTVDGLRVYIASVELVPEPAARVWPINPVTGTKGAALSAAFDPRRPQLSLSADGNVLYLPAADESLIVVNTRSNNPIRRLRVGEGKSLRILRVLGAPDNRHLWVLTPRRLLLWDPYAARADLSQELTASVVDLAVSADKSQLWSLLSNTDRSVELRQWNSQKEGLPVVGRYNQPGGTNRVLLSEPTVTAQTGTLPKVAVVGFETGPVRFGRFPDVAEIVGGSLLRTRRFEILSPVQVRSVLEALDLSPAQLQGDPDSIRQVASLLGADFVLVGEPLKVEMPNRGLEALTGLITPWAAFLLPQLSSPKVFSSARAFDQNGQPVWKESVVNFDPSFFAGKTDTILLSNAMVITGQDIANRFSKGAFNQVREQAKAGAELPPLARDGALAQVRTVALLGPDSTLYNSLANSAESLGQALAPELSSALGWEVSGPSESFSRLAELGIDRPQILTTDPKLLARALGVDAVMIGLVRSSTYANGAFLGMGGSANAEVVLQFQLVDQQGRVLWKDIQVRTVEASATDSSRALRQAARVIVERLREGVQGPGVSSRKAQS